MPGMAKPTSSFSLRGTSSAAYAPPLGHLSEHHVPRSDQVKRIRDCAQAFYEAEGRRPRVLLCSFGTCTGGRPDDQFAIFLANAGFDVDIGPRRQSPDSVARQAVEADVHGIHVTLLSDESLTLLQKLYSSLCDESASDIFITAEIDGAKREQLPHVHLVPRGDYITAANTIEQLLPRSA